MPTALSDKSDEISVHIIKLEKKEDNSTQHVPTLDLNQSETNDYPQFNLHMCSTGKPVYQFLCKEEYKVVDNLCQSPMIAEVAVKDWGFLVRFMHDGNDFYVLVQRYKLCIVGFIAKDGSWILLKGRYDELVRECVDTCFRVLDGQGNFIEPKMVDLGTSCCLLRKSSGVKLTDLKLNKQAMVNAVVYLRGVSLGDTLFDKKMSALHVLILSQMICETTKIKQMACEINRYYLSNDLDTPNLSASLIELQRLWTKASRKVAGWAFGKDTNTFQLNGVNLTAEQVIAIYTYTKGVTLSELESD